MSIFMFRYRSIKTEDDNEDNILGTFLIEAADTNEASCIVNILNAGDTIEHCLPNETPEGLLSYDLIPAPVNADIIKVYTHGLKPVYLEVCCKIYKNGAIEVLHTKEHNWYVRRNTPSSYVRTIEDDAKDKDYVLKCFSIPLEDWTDPDNLLIKLELALYTNGEKTVKEIIKERAEYIHKKFIAFEEKIKK